MTMTAWPAGQHGQHRVKQGLGMATFGERARNLMRERGISLRRLAKQINYDVGYLSKVLNGLKNPSRPLIERLDTALKADGELIALIDRESTQRPARKPRRVAPELATYFRDQLAGHYTADRHLGATRLIPVVFTQYGLLCTLADEAQGRLRQEMWSLAAAYAGFLAWLHQDGGNLDKSAHWHNVMLERAHRSLDPQLVAFALHNKAMLYVDMLDGPGAVDLAQAALTNTPELCAKVRVLALQQAAHGTSLIGGDDARQQCERLLDKAAALIDRIDDPYPWGGACLTPHYLDVQRATCYVRLNVIDEALTLWETILPSLAPRARRDFGVFRARQAQALAAGGEPERAVEIAEEVVGLAEETGSIRMRKELRLLRSRMKPWAQHKSGRELGEILRNIGGGQ